MWVVTAAMLFTSLPLMSVTADAANLDISTQKYTYKLSVTTANERNAKTNNTIYCIVQRANGEERQIKLDNKGDDFRKGGTDTYTFTLDWLPWEIHAVGFQHKKGLDAVKIEKFSFWLDGGPTFLQDKTINTWFNKYKKTYSVMSRTDRQIRTVGNFNSVFDQTYYYDYDYTGAANKELYWNSMVSDQYFREYNMFNYVGAVDVSFSASGRSYNNGSSISMQVLKDNGLADIKTNDMGYVYGLKLYTSKLLEFMQRNKIYKFSLTATLDYEYDYDEYSSHSRTYTIYRKGFGLGNASAVTSAYTPFRDQNFYNANPQYNTFEIKIPVLNYDNYYAASLASSLAACIENGQVTARVYYDTVENGGYVTPFDVYSRGSDIYLKCRTPVGFNNTAGTGLTVRLDNAMAYYNGWTYRLDTANSDYSYYISTHKVDTAGPDLNVLQDDGSAIGTSFDVYRNQHFFKLQLADGRERIFHDNGNGTRSEGYFSYELLTKDGKTVLPLENYKTSVTTKTPYTTNAVYNVKPKETVEGDCLLRITTRDMANNASVLTYPIKIDTVAPRAAYVLKEKTPVDGSRRNEYTFTIEDASGTGKLYYCIVPEGQTMPEPDDFVPGGTGTVESQYGIWSFIDQTNSANTVVISVEKGQYLNGTLYWYTVDAAENDSRNEKIKGTNAAGYYYTDFSINNIDAECKLIVEDLTPGRPRYDISFETNENNRVTYLWRGANIVTKSIVYDDTKTPGDSRQLLPSGSSISLNGNYTLEYTVTTPDGSSKTYTKDFVFDTVAPQIRFSYPDTAVSAEKAVSLEVSDITKITELSYQLYQANGTPVGEAVELSCGLPVVRAELVLEPEVSGAYYIAVTAVDVNGQRTRQESELFGIRNAVPVITAKDVIYKYDGTYYYQLENDYSGIPLTNGRENEFKWSVTELYENHIMLKDSYALFYRFSADGVNYGIWNQIPARSEGAYLTADVEHLAPTVLHEGENRIWIQAAFALNGTDPAEIRSDYMTVNGDTTIFLDVTAPEYTFAFDSLKATPGSVYGTLVFSDTYSSVDELKFSFSDVHQMLDVTESRPGDSTAESGTESTDDGSTAVEDESEFIGTSDEPQDKTVCIEIKYNGDYTVTLEDKAGNSVEVPITVACIDKEPPDVYMVSAAPVEAGDRQDYMLDFWIDNADDSTTEFALIKPLRELGDSDFVTISPSTTPDPDHPGWNYEVDLESDEIVWGALPEEAPDGKHGTILDYQSMKVNPITTDIEYPNGESRTNYQVLIYGDEYEGTQNLPEEPFILAVKTSDVLGNQTIQSVGNYMLLKNATARVLSAAAVSEYAYGVAGIQMEMSVPVYIVPYAAVPASMLGIADGRLDTSADTAVAEFAESVNDAAVYYSTEPVLIVRPDEITSGSRPIFFADEAGRVYKQTLTVADPAAERPEAGTEDPCTLYLRFIESAPVDVTVYAGKYDPTNVTSGTIEAYSDTVPYYIELKIKDEFLNEQDTEAVFASVVCSNSEVLNSTAYDENGNPYQTASYVSDFSPVDEYSTDTTKVFVLNDTLNPNKSITYDVKITETVPGETEGAEPTVTVSSKGSAYQLTLRDTTPPDVMVHYSTRDYTNQPVTATVTASDAQLMTNTDGENDDPDGTEASDDHSGIAEIAITEFMPQERFIGNYGYYPPDENSIRSYSYTAVSDEEAADAEVTLTFNGNGIYGVRVTNEVGLVSYRMLEVTNICQDAITDADYSLSYFDPNDYDESNGCYRTVDPNAYYSEVAVEFNYLSYEKHIEVVNNGGSAVKLLTPKEPSFTFVLRDKYGNTAQVVVSHEKFDTTAPTVTCTPTVDYKTNQPYPVLIEAADTESGVKTVQAVHYTGIGEVPVDVTRDESGMYRMTVSESGLYAVTVIDGCGNRAETAVTVTNIDTVKPELAQPKYTVAQNVRTRSDVGVKLYYTKPNVTLKSVTLPEGMTGNDISVNYKESIIRFFENGVVKVTYVDAYGNENTSDVAVTNIWRKVPSLTAVKTTAEDALAVEVSFAADGLDTLSEYYVIHNGVTPVDEYGSVLRADKVKFTFVDNGTYTFYVHDTLGNMQEIELEITEIDRTAPTITDVSWTYTYTDENGEEQEVTQSVTPGEEAGYNVVEDETHPATDRDITATVTTDKGTKLAGSLSNEYKTVHSVVYDANGWFNFDMTARNDLMDRYGLGIYLIDKEAPVIEGVEDMIFFENPNAGTPYSKDLLTYTAYDVRFGEKIDLTNAVEIDWGGFDPDDFTANVFDKNKPYTITYTVRDKVGNETSVRRTVTLVGLFDTTIRVNGGYTDANGMIEADGGAVALTLDNFAGRAWARYESGIHTMGQMKNIGTVIAPEADGSFCLEGLSEGWYTFYVQTDLRDYFCVKVFVYEDEA